jgi:Ca2+-binding RTX toxin-like protein
VVSGGKGKDTLDFRESNGAVDVNMIVDDYPVEASGFENVGGTNFDDSLIGDDGKNRLSGHDGDDTLSGGGGDDVLEGGDNNFAASNDDELSGGDGNDRLNGDTGVDVLSGGLGNDYLDTGGRFQSGNDDTALGGAGDDTIVTDAGDDLCNGGKGNDTVVLNVFNFTVVVDFLAGSLVNIGSGMLTLSSIENVTANSTRGDILSGNNLDFSDFLVGGAPVDLTFVGGAAFSSANQLRFEAGSLFGNTDADGDAEFEVALTGVSGLATTDFVF